MRAVLRCAPRAARGALIAIAVSCALSALVASWPALRLAYRGRELHVALETAGGLIALLAGFLMTGRFARRRRVDDLLLATALVGFALIDLAFLAAPDVLAAGGGRSSVWAALVGRVLAAVALAAGAMGLPRRLRHGPAAGFAVLLPLATVVAPAVVVALLAVHLPAPLHESPAGGSLHPRLAAHPAVPAVQLLTMSLFAVATVGLVRRAAREKDPFLAWLAAATVLAAFARLHYFLYPSLYTDWVSSGDGFWLLFHVAVLAAAALELRGYWRTQVDAAVLEERRRMARDLHDGLAQEIAYIKRNLHWLDDADDVVQRLRGASDRALIEARRAVAALSDATDRPLQALLAEAVHDVAARERIRAIVDLGDDDTAATAEEREALVRIACEAVTNAARHGRSDVVRVELQAGDLLRMRISDAGAGFDAAAPLPAGHFGLAGMRERALALGGHFKVSSTPGGGTEVEVVL